ncbi:hypothetical protein B0H16DRAFT_1487098 [Mycena metata]|uniref:Uncharacterized protein n=1 Tax=Mycena metata TaxID=1033252 RepID=A0AAD7DEN0_9AGAR|nr:hypothetical protein B0H16DRAFT_1487098 [Mycena metata]
MSNPEREHGRETESVQNFAKLIETGGVLNCVQTKTGTCGSSKFFELDPYPYPYPDRPVPGTRCGSPGPCRSLFTTNGAPNDSLPHNTLTGLIKTSSTSSPPSAPPPPPPLGYVDQVDVYGTAIYSALLNFRTLVDREHSDPPDVAGVRKILCTRRAIFGTADEDERFTVLNLSVSRDDPETFVIRINKDFYIDDQGNILSDECLVVGEHGIDGFMSLMDELLDVLPVSHGSYEALYEALFKTVSVALRGSEVKKM